MREEHCAFAECTPYGRCIAVCWRNYEEDFKQDCIGNKRDEEPELMLAGKEYQLGGRFKKGHGTKL
jgi:hypothetical protein